MPDTDPYDAIVAAASPRVPRGRNYDDLIEKHAKTEGVDPNLIRAVMGQESGGQRTVVSPKGARGLMQLMPATASRFGTTDVNDPDQNIRGGARYLRFLNDRFKGDTDKVLAGYNAGEGAVDKYRGIPPYKETQNYVPAVKARYRRLTGQEPSQNTSVSDPYDAIVEAANPKVETSQPKTSQLRGQPLKHKGAEMFATPVKATQAGREMFALPDQGVQDTARKISAIERRQRQTQATHPVSARQIQPIDEAAAKKVRGALAASAPPGYGLLPESAKEFIGGTIASGTPGLVSLGAGIAKLTPRDPLANPQDREAALGKMRDVADEISRGAHTMDVQANRTGITGTLSQGAKDVLSGTIASAPAMGLVALGMPPSAAFALTSALEEQGRGGDLASTLQTATINGLIGELWELPTPTKTGLLSRLEKGLMVGTGTLGLTQDPANAITQGLIASVMKGKPKEDLRARLRDEQRTGQVEGVAQPPDVRQEAPGNVVVPNPRAVGEVAEGVPQKVAEAPEVDAGEYRPPIRTVEELSIDSIIRNRAEDRGESYLAGLESSGHANDPITVTRDVNGDLLLTDGHHRLELARSKGQRTIRADVITIQPRKPPQAKETRAQVKESQPAAQPETTAPSATETPNVAPSESPRLAPSSPEPRGTAAAMASVAASREARGVEQLPKFTRKSDVELLRQAREANERDPSAALRIAEQSRELNDVETIQLDQRAEQLKGEYARVMKELGDASDPAVISAKGSEADAIEAEITKLEKKTDTSGTEQGRAFRARRLIIGDDFSKLGMVQRAKKAKGRDLTPDERTRYNQLSEKIADLERQISEQAAKQGISRIERESRREKRQVTRKVLDDEAATIKQNIAAEFARIRTQQGIQPSGLAGIDPEGVITKLALKYAKNRFNAGLTDAAQLIDDVHGVLSEFTSVTKRQVAEMISGYQLPQASGTKESLQKTLADLREEMRSALRQADIEAGKISPRPEGPKKSEARRSGIPLQGPRITEAPKLGPRETKEQIQSRYQEQINDLERRIRERDFTPKTKRGPTVLDRETQRLQEQAQKLKSQFDAELERSSPWYFLKTISGIRKSGMLSGYLTHLRNIGGTAAYQGFEEVRRVPSVIADAALSAATGRRTVTLSPSAMLDGVTQALTVGRKEAGEILRLGASEEQLSKQQLHEINTGSKVIDLAFNSVFRFMSASDRIFYQGSYKRNLVERAQAQAITERRTDPSVRIRERARELAENPSQQLEADAKHDALVSTFNNNNFLSKKIMQARAGSGAKNHLANFALDMVMPFDRTPTNVIARVIEASPAGYAKNAGQLAKALWKRSMSAAEQRSFQETFGRATTGTAVMALGFALAAKGVLVTDEYGTTKLKIGKHEINLSAVAPLGTLLGVGAGIYQASKKPSARGYGAAVLKPLADQPLLRASSQVSDFIKDPARSGSKFAANTAFSFVPFSGAVRAAAQDTDVKRYPRGMKESFQYNFPVWRQSLPSEKPPPAGRESRGRRERRSRR